MAKFFMHRSSQEWWQTYFDESYLRTYVDILSPSNTKRQVEFIIRTLQPRHNEKILDLACGQGRHALALAEKGYQVTGVDYSEPLIRRAKEEARKKALDARFYRQNMLEISWISRFDYVLSIFTSIGYFASEEANERIFAVIAQVLKPGGKLLLEVHNTSRQFRKIAAKGKVDKRSGFLVRKYRAVLSTGLKVSVKDEFDPLKLRWPMTLKWRENGKLRLSRSDVRVYFLPEIRHLLEENGLVIKKLWGDFAGSAFSLESRHLIILAQKKE